MNRKERPTHTCAYCKETFSGMAATMDRGPYDGATLHEGCAVYLYKKLGYEAYDRIKEELEDSEAVEHDIRARKAREKAERRIEDESIEEDANLRAFRAHAVIVSGPLYQEIPVGA